MQSRARDGGTDVQPHGDRRSQASSAGTVRGLKESEAETLEDVFIRLVGRSISEE